MANPQTPSQPQQPAKQQYPEWVIAWDSLQKSPEYQNADSDMEREAMRLDVFKHYVAPRLSPFDLDRGFQEFDRVTRPKGDPTSGLVHDFARKAQSDLYSSLGDTAAMATLGESNSVSNYLKGLSDEAALKMSPTSYQAVQNFGIDHTDEKGLHFREGSSLRGGALTGFGSLTSMIPMIYGGWQGRVIGGALAKTGKAASKEMVKKANRAKAIEAMERIKTAERRGAMVGQSAAMAAQMGGATGQQAEQEVWQATEGQLRQSHQYNDYRNSGMSPEQARAQLASDAARSRSLEGAAMGAVTGRIIGPRAEKLLMGKGAATRGGAALGMGAVESLEEGVEGAGQQYLSNLAQRDVGLNVDPMKGVIGAGVTGPLVGAPFGAVVGAATHRKPPNLDDVTRNLDAAAASANTLETELSNELDPETRVRKEAELEKTYRTIMDYRAIAKDLKENPPEPQKAKKEKPAEQKPAAETAARARTATPKAAEQDTEPLESEASWVDTDVDLKIAELSRDVRQAESNMRRSDQNGAGIDDHRLLERDLGQKRALLERLKALSFNRDKQHYFENRDEFYDWIDRSIGTDQEQAAARREMKHRQIRQQPGGNFPTVVPGQQTVQEGLSQQEREAQQEALSSLNDLGSDEFTSKSERVAIPDQQSTTVSAIMPNGEYETFNSIAELKKRKEALQGNKQDNELRAGMEGVLRDEAYQEAAQAIPEAADIRHDRRQIQRQGLANRTRDAARTRLGRHQRQQQFEQLQAQHEQQTRSQSSLAEQTPAAPAGKSEQRETETDERAVQQSPEPTAKPGRFEATSERQRARLRYLRERLEKTASEAGKRAATLLRSASAAMATHGNQTVTIDGNTLTIKSGRVDRDEFNRFTRALGAKAPRTRVQHKTTVTNAAARTIQTIRDRYARLDDASSKKLVKMADTVIFTLEKRGVLTQKYGDNVLRIDPGGKVSAQDLRKFRQWLEGPENTSTGYWKQIIRERADKLGRQPHRAAMARTALLAISQKETRTVPYGNKQTLTFKRGQADHNDLLAFTSWLNPGRATPEPAAEPRKHSSGRGSLAASTRAGLDQKARQQQKEQARRQQYADYFHNRVRKAMASNHQAIITIGALTDSHQEFADVNRDSKKKAALGRVVINALKNGRTETIEFGDTLPRATLTIRNGKAKNRELDDLITYLASTRIPEKPKAPPALTGPSFADEATHIWTNPETGEKVPVIYEGRSDYDMDLYLDENGEEYIGDQSQFQPTGNRNAATEAEANRQQKEKELAELDRQDREKESQAREQAAEDEQKRRDAQRQAEEQAAIEKEQKELQAEENLQREAEEKIKRDKEQLEIEKQEIDQVNAEWEPERQRQWAERRKQDTGGEEGPAKLSWKHSRLVNANIIGNSKGQGFTKEYQAKSALSQKQLEDTHFVFQTFAGDFFLKRKEQLETASKPVEKQEPAPDVSAKPEKVSTSEERVQETAESEQKPPHLNFRKQDRAVNSGMLLPRVGKKFTDDEQQTLLEWVRARGLSAHIKGSGIYAVDWDSSGKNWDSLEDGLEEQRLAKQAEKDRKEKEAADQKAAEVQKEKDENPAYQWIVDNMGSDFANDYNLLALARVLIGDVSIKDFQGLMGRRWVEPIEKLGIEVNEESETKDVLAAIKQVYESQGEKETAESEQVSKTGSSSPLDDITPPVSSKLKDLNPENAASVAEEVAERERQQAEDSAAQQETSPSAPEPTGVRKRRLKRNTRRAELDEDMQKANKELAEAFRSALSAPSSSAAFVLEKVLPLSIRMGSLYVQKGYLKFADWADNMLYGLDAEGIDPEDVLPHLKAIYAATKQNATDDQYARMDGEGDVRQFDLDSLFEEESTDSTGESHVSITGSNLERDSRGSGTETQVGQENVPHDSGRTGSTDGRTGRQDGEGRGREQRDTGVPEAGSIAGGTRSDTDVLEDHGSYGDEGRPADSGERSGSRDTGREGTHAERRADQQVENAAAATGKLTLEQKVELQEKADSIPTKHGDLQNIRDTLPVLLPEQQEDVLKGETRLYTNGEAGMLFTNGTGTGKTFTGLGHIKRLARDGKDSILIMAPSDKVANDWIQSGKLLGLDITQLTNTRNAGKGIVVTTYDNAGMNDSLVHRNWDMVVADESHKLMQNADGDETLSLKTLRAITLNPRGIHSRHAMLMADEIAEYQELGKSIDNLTRMANLDDTMDQARDAYLKEAQQKTEQRTALGKKLDAHLEKVRNEVGAINKKDRTKVLFLSATPFAYHKNIPYADGYLFDIYGTEPDRHTGYNEPGAFERFFVENFGYRMRYNKLTAPDKDVDVGLMEREFNQKLKDSGALSGRRLEVDADYSREFVLVEDAIGQKIDEGIELIRTDKRLSKLQSLLDGKFDYLKQVQMLEAIKASHAVERIMKHQALGRKVVVFHNFKVGGTQNPFMFRKGTDRDVNDAIDLFNDLRPDLAKLEMNLPSPIITLQQAFPDLLLFNGDVKKSERRANADKFNDDNNPGAVILVQRAAGKEGVSLHDTTGKHQRVLMDLGLPGAPTDLIQTEGRIYRVGQVTNAIDEYLVTGTNFEKYAFANKVASRASTAENLALGHEGRQLQPAIIEAFKDMRDTPPSEKQGSGGKDFDRQNSEVSYYDRAKTYYFARMKRTSKNKSAEGTDYFATPEPAGLKMFEMAGIRRGESMLEPSAGHGAIARWFPEYTRNTFIEPSYKLAAELGLNSNGKILNQDFEGLALVNKFDGIVMNPPFGVGGKTAVEHVEKAMKHTRDGGRIVALIPTGPAADKRFAKLEESETARDFYKVAEILLPSVMFKRAGTSVMGKIVVWEKQEGENNPSQLQQKNRDFTDITEIKELFDRLEDFTLPDRLPPEPKKTKAVEGEISLTNEMGNETTFSVMDSQHTKTGEPLYVVNMEGSLLEDQYKAISAMARQHGGYYIQARMRNYYKPPAGVTPKGKPTFTFKSDEARNDFLAGLQEMSAAPQAETDSRYRLAEPGALGIKPYQAKALQKQLDKLTGLESKVVQSESDLPLHLQKHIRREGMSGLIKGIYDDGRVYIIADRSENLLDAVQTVLHEVVGHKGVRGLLKGKLDSVLDRIYRDMPSAWRKNLRKAYASQIRTMSRTDQRRLIAEEYLAHLAETNPGHGWVKSVVAMIRKLIRQYLPFVASKWRDIDSIQLLMDARKHVLSSQTDTVSGGRRYSAESDADRYRNDLRNALKSLRSFIPAIRVSNTPEVLQRLGIKDLPVTIRRDIVRKVINGVKHAVPMSVIEQLPELLSDPELVFTGSTPNSFSVVINAYEKGQPVMVALQINKSEGRLQVNRIASVFGRPERQYRNWIGEGKLRYVKNEKSLGLVRLSPLQLRGVVHQLKGFDGIIISPEEAVNLSRKIIRFQRDRPTYGQGKPAVIRYQLASLDSISQAEMKKKALSTVSEAKEFSRNNLLGFFGGKQLAEMYGNIFDKVSDTIGHNPLKQLDKLLQKMTSERSNYASQAEKIDQRWSKLARISPAVYNLLSSVMHRSTLWQQDPREDFKLAGDKSIDTLREILDNPASEKQRFKFQKQLDNELARKAQYDQLKKDWEILSPAAQALYTHVENFYRKQWKDTKKALIEKVNGTQLDPHAKRSARAEIELMFHKALNGPYFPLMRFGDYVITATNAEGEHYRAHYETRTAMQEARADLEKQGYQIKFTGKRQDFNARDMAGVGKFSARVSRILYGKMGDSVPDTEKAAILSEINQITLELMPEMSSAKRSLHRKNVPGYHENARRAFDATSLTQANRISRIRYGWQMEAEIDKMMTVASQDESDSPLTTDERIKARQVASEMSKRHDEIMNPKGNAISAAATNFGFFMYMGGSIGAGLVNMTQNLLIGLPQMASQYGFRNTARVMAQVTKDYFGKGGKMPEDLDGLLQNSWFSLENSKGIPADERALIKALVRDGTIETTQAHVLAQMADMDIKPEAVKKKDWYVKLTRASGMFFHNAEVANRQIAALTAYRLAKQKGQTTTDASGNPDEATVDKIRKAVFDAHYDYSSTNRPRYFRSNWAKVFLLFKQYSQNTLFFLGRNFHQALKGESPEIKQQARKTLGTTFAMHGVFAGALGLPTASVWLGLAGLFMGDEDDPVDPEVALRNGLASLFGREVAHAMSKGLFNALLGIDIHSRTSANDLLFRSSDYDMSARQEAQSFIISAMGGPLASMATNLYASAHRFAAGEQWEGLEGLMPKFIRDGMRAVRYNTEGMQNSQGKTLLDDFSSWETGWKLAGLSSARESEVYDVNRAITQPRQAIQRRRSMLMGQLDRAETREEQQQARQQIRAFNDAQRERGRQWALIEEKDIRASLKSRRKTREESVHGVYLSSQQEGMRELGGFGMVTR